MDVNQIVNLAVRIVFLIVSAFIVPWFKQKYDESKQRKIIETISKYVTAAEQLYDSTEGATKKAWVQEKLLAAGININLDDIDATIEACVYELHNALKGE